MLDDDAAQSVREFFSLQEERIKVYKKLDQAHAAYLDTSPDYDFLTFRQAVHDCTETFSRISKQIIALEGQFRGEPARGEITRLIRKIQDNERVKLELTGLLQLAKQRHQDAPGAESAEEVTQLKHKINSAVSQIAELLQDLRYEAEDLLT